AHQRATDLRACRVRAGRRGASPLLRARPRRADMVARAGATGVAVQGLLLVFLGAGIGGSMRHGVNLAAQALWGTTLPFGTLAVNVAGSFAMGLLAGWVAPRFDPGDAWRL